MGEHLEAPARGHCMWHAAGHERDEISFAVQHLEVRVEGGRVLAERLPGIEREERERRGRLLDDRAADDRAVGVGDEVGEPERGRR
jgi:hypothetical protein